MAHINLSTMKYIKLIVETYFEALTERRPQGLSGHVVKSFHNAQSATCSERSSTKIAKKRY